MLCVRVITASREHGANMLQTRLGIFYYLHGFFVPLCDVHSIILLCRVERHRHELSLRLISTSQIQINFVLLQIFAPDAGRQSLCSWRRFFSGTPHPYHFLSSGLQNLVRPSSYKLHCEVKFVALSFQPCLFRSTIDQTLEGSCTRGRTHRFNWAVQFLFSVHFHGLSRPTVL